MKTALLLVCALASAASADTRKVGPGVYHPAFRSERVRDVEVPAFWLDRTQVTNAQFRAFVKTHPEWARDQVSPLLADEHYLADQGPAKSPVVDVSWFAARAYCESRGGRLPMEAEWELAAQESGTDEEILAWYAQPTPAVLPPVGHRMNARGIYDLHGLVWEWIDDFSATMIGVTPDQACAAEATAARDPSSYATFMRFAFRSALEGKSTTKNLGFRCAYDAPVAHAPRATKVAHDTGIYAFHLPLRDQDDRAITLDAPRGHRTVIGMFYGSCLTACPALIGELAVMIGELPPNAAVRVLLVSFDPARDTPAALHELAAEHRLDKRWTLATPRNESDARALAAMLGIKFKKLDNGEFWHTSVVLALDEKGTPVARMDGLGRHEELLKALRR